MDNEPQDELVERVGRICSLAEYENRAGRVPTDDLRGLLDRIADLEARLARKDAALERAVEALRKLLGTCEIAAVLPEAVGKTWVPAMDAPELEQARVALADTGGRDDG